MTASEDEAIFAAAKALYYTCSDEEIRIRCLEREEYFQDLRNYERAIAEKEEKIERNRVEYEQNLRNYERVLEQERSKREQERSEQEKALRRYENEIAQLRKEIEHLKKNQ